MGYFLTLHDRSLFLSPGYKTEGIFRKTGNCSRQKELRRQLLTQPLPESDLAGYTVHDVANVLKLLLRGIEEPIVTEKLVDMLLAIVGEQTLPASCLHLTAILSSIIG